MRVQEKFGSYKTQYSSLPSNQSVTLPEDEQVNSLIVVRGPFPPHPPRPLHLRLTASVAQAHKQRRWPTDTEVKQLFFSAHTKQPEPRTSPPRLQRNVKALWSAENTQ